MANKNRQRGYPDDEKRREVHESIMTEHDPHYGYGGFREDLFYQEDWRRKGPHTGRGPKGYQRSDEAIEVEANARLTYHGELDATNIKVRVENGEITLEGTVDSRRAKRMAEDALEAIAGVNDIHNHLRLQQER
jgi:hypothetical protein